MFLPDSAVRDALSRRAFLGRSAHGIGALALTSLLNPALLRTEAGAAQEKWRGILKEPHTPAKIKRVIWLTMAGGPSHLETFDYKPELAKLHDQPMPESLTKGQQLAQLQGAQLKCFGPQWGFQKFGQSGAEMCELFPHLGSVADDICIIRSMQTEAINHDPAHCFINTGSTIPGRPAMGAWITYGLGSDSENLPGLRRPDEQRKRGAESADCREAMVERVSAEPFPGRAASRQRRSSPLSE
jgi:hypothetical protein